MTNHWYDNRKLNTFSSFCPYASTQTACSTVEQVEFFERVGFARAILERNLSGAQIAHT